MAVRPLKNSVRFLHSESSVYARATISGFHVCSTHPAPPELLRAHFQR